MSRFCVKCGGEFVNGVCPKCGNTVLAQEQLKKEPNSTLCPNCNVPYNNNGICPRCGRKKANEETGQNNKTNKNIYVPIVLIIALIALIGLIVLYAVDNDLSCVNTSSGYTSTGTTNSTTTTSTTTTAFSYITANYPPVFTSYTASSFYHKDENNKCIVEDAFDGDTQTCWQDGVDGYGVGEWLKASAATEQLVSSITIYNGYQKKNNSNLYDKNSRVRGVTIYWNGGSQSFTLEDNTSPQVLWLDEPVATDYITVEIDSVYKGDKYADTCITDIIIE